MSHKPVLIQHVKFCKDYGTGIFYPAADTDQFESLVNLPRGSLVFFPADENYGPKRGEVEERAHLVAAAPEMLSMLNRILSGEHRQDYLDDLREIIAKAEGKS